MSPAAWRYPVTALEPGARDVLTVGPTVSPRATAFRARSPAPIITVGFEVFVQEVIAAIATEPVRTVAVWPRTAIVAVRYPRSSAAGSSIATWAPDGSSRAVVAANDGGSLAGKDSADD